VYVIDNPGLLSVGYLIYKHGSMTKIIKITKSYQNLPLESYITAALNFALLALWPFEKTSKSKIRICQSYIKTYLVGIPDMQATFITFCEKVLLVNRTLSVSNPFVIDPPAIWLNPMFKNGYSSTNEIHRLIRKNQVIQPHYLEGITTLSKGYWEFINQPKQPVLLKIHDRLYYLRQYGLISLLGQVTLKYILETKQLI
jgi:hypothetical protein